MDSLFTQLGRSVLAEWKGQNFSPSAFPEIACGALEARPPAEHVELSALIREFLVEDEQPFQTQSGFGEPELVVYDDPRFYIQLLFWLEGTTDIHQHKFSGAFHVLQGSSIHSEFAFENAESISAHLRVGDLRLKSTHLLETGSTVRIISGREHIHSLFHLETPSVTVVIRTHTDPGTGPQFTYLPPHLAVDPFHHDTLTARRKQLLDVMEKTRDADYPHVLAEMLERLDFERGFFVLQNCMAYLRELDQWEKAWSVFEQRHGRLAEYVGPSLDGIVRRDRLVGLRSAVTEVEHRFFLALLLTVERREDILALVEQRFPGDPVETIMQWADELAETSEIGTSILDAEFPEELAVPLSQQSTMFMGALWQLMRPGVSGEGDGRDPTAADLELFRDAFSRSSFRSLVL
jgi:hypothetical protein